VAKPRLSVNQPNRGGGVDPFGGQERVEFGRSRPGERWRRTVRRAAARWHHRAGRGRFGRISGGGTEIFERGRGVDDQRYEEWKDTHRLGYVLNIRERQSVVLHHADCHALELMDERAFQQRMTSATKVCASL
jgi:hypothetical protein